MLQDTETNSILGIYTKAEPNLCWSDNLVCDTDGLVDFTKNPGQAPWLNQWAWSTLPTILVKHLGLTNGFGRLCQQSWSSTLASPMVSADFPNSFNQALGLLSGSNSSIGAINLEREWSLSAIHLPVNGHRNVERRVHVLA